MLRKNKQPIITIMCDYCADGLWYNGAAIDTSSSKIPNNYKLLKRRIENWQKQYHIIMLKYDKSFSSRTSINKMRNSNEYKIWLKEGLEIAKKIRKLTPGKYKVEYFHETTCERTPLKKGKEKLPKKRKQIIKTYF